jgi:4'-phosphopantetheinyl transferase
MDLSWQIPETIPYLVDGMVQVWRIRLDGPDRARVLDEAYALLNEEERARAAAMRALARREEFIAGRGNLRRLLGIHLGVEAATLALEQGEHGKPRLKKDHDADSGLARMTAWAGGDVEFNVAHSGGVVLIALSRAGAIGVDVERADRQIEALDVARTAFPAKDVSRIEIARNPVAEFFRCWTRLEAVGKADGRGLLKPADGEGDYFVREIEVGPEFSAAVATERFVTRWLFLDLPDFRSSNAI